MKLTGWLAAMLPMMTAALGPAAAGENDCPARPERAQSVAVSEVMAGDMLKLVDGTTVRLAGVEVPRGWKEDTTGEDEARQALWQLLEEDPVVFIPVHKGEDRHGRRAGHVFTSDGENVALLLLRQGQLRSRPASGEERCLHDYRAAERIARESDLGHWRGPDYAIRSAEDSSLVDRNGLYELVAGRVLSVGTGSRMVFLDFGRNYRQDFTVMVPPAVVKSLSEQGVDLESFSGRSVLVRGVIEESGGPALRLGHSADIELLD